MKFLKIIILVLAALFLGFYAIGAMLPKEYSVSRTITMESSPSLIFEQVNNLKNNERWSPWLSADSTMQWEYGSTQVGVNASYSWVSEYSGKGSLTIVESIPTQLIKTQLDFKESGIAQGFWKFEPSDSTSTIVTWGFSGIARSIPERYFGLMMDKMIGPSFDQGLNNIKSIVEE